MIPLQEYPRPQLERSSWECLNGIWEAEVLDENGASIKKEPILVPYSPEAKLSGFDHLLLPSETLVYRRHVSSGLRKDGGHLILHFGASDYLTTVKIDGEEKLVHRGGYLPFSLEVEESEFDLEVVVKDPSDTDAQQRGKQKMKRGGIWYTPQSGLWQTVWMERVPETYITRLSAVPDTEGVFITVEGSRPGTGTIAFDGKTYDFQTSRKVRITPESPHLWTPEDPYLYMFSVAFGEDEARSYTGLRSFGVGEDEKGTKRLLLNGKPYYHHGVLDQGYYEGGLYTPESDEEMVNDILLVKSMGFNTLRKHIKIEPLRWYYHCDRLGILVWQDMVNGGGSYSLPIIALPLFTGSFLKDDRLHFLFGRKDKRKKMEFEEDVKDTVEHLKNVVSIAMWVPFNEGWGQFDSVRIAGNIQKLDPTRTIDMHSGWHDQGKGEFKSLHVYFRPYRFHRDKLGRCVILSEFGGYSCVIHRTTDKTFGYKGFRNSGELTEAVVQLYENEIIPAKEEGLAASIYTQVSDVEDELNGLITYDRKTVKMDREKILQVSRKLLG